jgi:hypothetical protein
MDRVIKISFAEMMEHVTEDRHKPPASSTPPVLKFFSRIVPLRDLEQWLKRLFS